MKKRIAIITILILILSMGMVSNAASSEVVKEARNGVIRVICTYVDDEGNSMMSTGSGFAIGEEGESPVYFVTNNHVIEENPSSVFIILDDMYDEAGNFNGIEATVIKSWTSPDLAILKIENTIATGSRTVLTLGSSAMVDVTDTIYTLGFPGVADDMTDTGSNLPSTPDDVTVTSGSVTKTNVQTNGTLCIGIDATLNPGNSGGPLLNEDGVVVGINTYGTDGNNLAISIDYITEYLNDNGFVYASASSEDTAITDDEIQSEDSAAEEVVATDDTVVEDEIVADEDTDGEDVDDEDADEEDEDDEDDEDESFLESLSPTMITLMAIAAVVLIGGVIILVLMLTKKSKQPEPSVYQEPAYIPEPEPLPEPVVVPVSQMTMAPIVTFKISCERGYYAGKEFPVEDVLRMGRDSVKCNLIYPQDAEGISSLHCMLQVNGNSVSVMDLGSTYGTFLKGGVKMVPNQPYSLSKGDCFYLANSNTKFIIK